ncbi:MAG: hypothetical protein U9Q69_03335 [Nanoarchaeota archaeon]|nr:hypothetical protein [Nanoarchaeota archaeon]
MRLTNKQITELISNIAGEDVPPLISILKGKKNISEFKLADELNITVNQMRNMLYRLHEYNLVYFNRKKDKKKGWYIYYWTLNLKNTKEVLVDFKKKQLQEFKARLERENQSMFYVCPNRCMRYDSDNAMENDFKCEECGELIRQQDNSKTITNIKARIEDMEKEIENAEKFKEKEFASFGKSKIKRARNAAKKKPLKKVKKKALKKAKKKPLKKVKKKSLKKAKKKPLKKVKKKVVKKKVKKKLLKKRTSKKNTKKKPLKKKSVKKKTIKKFLKKKAKKR